MDALESVQHRAGCMILRVNRHASRQAVRFLLGLTSLATRRDVALLRYAAHLATMAPDRLTRRLVMREQLPNQAHGPALNTFWSRVRDVMGSEWVWLKRSQHPRPSLADDGFPVYWRSIVTEWGKQRELELIRTPGPRDEGTSLRLLRRLVEGVFDRKAPGPGFYSFRVLPILLLPTSPANQLRIRFLTGSHSLNERMVLIDGRRKSICYSCFYTGVESVEHFLLECPAYRGARKYYRAALRADCSCEKCWAGFQRRTALGDTEGNAVFMLGGGIGVLTPCEPADAAAHSYVAKAWRKRCAKLSFWMRRAQSAPSSSESEGELPMSSAFPCHPEHTSGHYALRPRRRSRGSYRERSPRAANSRMAPRTNSRSIQSYNPVSIASQSDNRANSTSKKVASAKSGTEGQVPPATLKPQRRGNKSGLASGESIDRRVEGTHQLSIRKFLVSDALHGNRSGDSVSVMEAHGRVVTNKLSN